MRQARDLDGSDDRFGVEMCGDDFRVPIPITSFSFPFPALGNLRLYSNSNLFPKSNPDSLPFPFQLKQEEFKKNSYSSARRRIIFVRMSTQNHSLL